MHSMSQCEQACLIMLHGTFFSSHFMSSDSHLYCPHILLLEQPRKPFLRRLQPIPLIILIPTLNAMERINHPPLLTRILLALMQQISVNQHQRPRLHLSEIINLLLHLPILFQSFGPLRALIGRKSRALAVRRPHKPVPNRRATMAAGSEGKTSILGRGVFEGVPESYRRGRVGVEEDGVLVGRHAATDLGLLADDHRLQDARVAELQRAGYRGILLVDRDLGEGRVEVVQVVADFVDGALFRFGQIACGVEGVWMGVLACWNIG